MNRSSRLQSILNKRADLWGDSETDSSSTSTTDQIPKSLTESDSSNDENSPPSPTRTCCLICSILPNLSNVNTCQKHLSSLIAPMAPTQVVYMVHPPVDACPKSHCHCRSKSKRRRRSSSSSSSSSAESRHYRKKRSLTVVSSDTSSQDDAFFSPDAASQALTTSQQCQQSNHSQARLSPSLPPSTSLNTSVNNSLRKYEQLVITSILQRTNQRNDEEIESMLKDTQSKPASEADSSDVIEITSNSMPPSPAPNLPVVHVKDDDEVCSDLDRKTGLINMAQVTEEMRNHEYPQPIILLQRVRLEQYYLLDEPT